tara:strand:- start:348 stop:578 length:231 start_codon:yes stop_codon:yes gene_type:complete
MGLRHKEQRLLFGRKRLKNRPLKLHHLPRAVLPALVYTRFVPSLHSIKLDWWHLLAITPYKFYSNDFVLRSLYLAK